MVSHRNGPNRPRPSVRAVVGHLAGAIAYPLPPTHAMVRRMIIGPIASPAGVTLSRPDHRDPRPYLALRDALRPSVVGEAA